MINKSIEINNGNSIKLLKITSDLIGHKYGEFHSSKKLKRYKNEK